VPDRPPEPPRVVLLADDDDDVARAYTRALELHGYVVHRARAGGEALAMIGVMPRIDAAIVDLVLPGAGGLDIVRRVREAQPAARILAITGLDNDAVSDAFHAAGADCFLSKPVELAALLAAISDSAS
jgi:DNA-binding response OmpR family regulator